MTPLKSVCVCVCVCVCVDVRAWPGVPLVVPLAPFSSLLSYVLVRAWLDPPLARVRTFAGLARSVLPLPRLRGFVLPESGSVGRRCPRQ